MRRTVDYWINYAERLKADRVNFDTLWEEIREYYAPYDPKFNTLHMPGEKRGERVFTSDPITSLDRFAANTYSQLMPLNEDYFSFDVDNDFLADDRDVKTWLDYAESAVYKAFRRSNFRNGTWLAHKSQATYGTGCLYLEYKGGGVFRFRARPLAETYLSENADEIVDTVIRCCQYSARQIVELWGNDSGEAVSEAMKTDPERRFEVLHVCTPKAEDEETFHPEHEYISLYILKENKKILNLQGGLYRGYFDNPYVITRLDKDAVSPYGYSRTAIALADVKTRNKLNELRLKALAKVVDPVIFAKNKALMSRLRLAPGSVNYINGDPSSDIRPFESAARWDVTGMEDERIKSQIDETFYGSSFNVPHRLRGPNISAREVDAAERASNRVSVPLVSRQENEFLQPLVLGTLMHLLRDGLIPPPPPQIQGAILHVRATGPLALDQQIGKVANSERLLLYVQQLANTQIGQEMAEAIDGADLMIQMAKVLDIFPSSVRTKKEVEQMRNQRQQMAAMQQMADVAKPAADAYSKLAPLLQGAG